jgi:nucleoside phosphorylase
MRPTSRSAFKVAIFCALVLEADAVEALFDEVYDRLGAYYGKEPGDTNTYITGRIGDHDIVLCCMPEMGKRSAASSAAALHVSYSQVQLALLVGVCGAAPYAADGSLIFRGDIIISDAVVEYDLGKQYPGGFQRKTNVKDTLGRPPREIRSFLTALSGRQTRFEFQQKTIQHLDAIGRLGTLWQRPKKLDDNLFHASYHHKHSSDVSGASCRCSCAISPDDICSAAMSQTCDDVGCDKKQIYRQRASMEPIKPLIHIGPIACADTVMKSGEHRDRLVKSDGIIGFEMEGTGVWDNIPCIVIKGVCDYADSHKDKAWQSYAAAAGASAAKTLLQLWRNTSNREGKPR